MASDAITEGIRSTQGRGRTPAKYVYVVVISLWLAAIAAAFTMDYPIASWVYKTGLYSAVRWSRAAQMVKAAGTYYLSIGAGLILLFWRGYGLRSAVLVWLSGAISGLYYAVAKWVVGRSRPIYDNGFFNTRPFGFDLFHGGLRGLVFSHANLSFPSGHACVAFASASALAMLIPRWRVALYAVAIAVGVQRILEGSHYPTDTIAGAGLGVLAALTAESLIARFESCPQSLKLKPKSR